MGIETFKPLTDEQRKIVDGRILSDARLIVGSRYSKGGARTGADGTLEMTAEQIESARKQMEREQGKGNYSDKAIVNGIEFSAGWDTNDQYYCVHFPSLKHSSKHFLNSTDGYNISTRPEVAKKAFDFLKQEALKVSDANALYEKLENFSRELSDEEVGDYS